ncbi:MAG: phosphodiester glycosidase family protein [Candidatus Sericytochromatia bacterium]
MKVIRFFICFLMIFLSLNITNLEAKAKKDPVEHIFIREFEGGNKINAHVIKVDLNNPRIVIELGLAKKSTNKKEVVSTIAKREKAIAAINGSFFHSRSSIHGAVGLLMLDGVVISDSGHRRTSLGITEDKKVVIGIPKIKNIAMLPEIGVNLNLNGINQYRGRNHITLYTPFFGSTTNTAKGGREIIVKDGKITGYGMNNSRIPKDGFVLSLAKADSKIADKYPIGTQVFINSVLPKPWNNVKTLITGSPQLLKNGQIYNTYYKEKLQPSIKAPNTRSAVGITGNNKFIMMSVTGRVTFNKLAKIMKKLGAKEALALDGGGSTEMYIYGKNMTSNYRPVTNAIVVKYY